MSTRYSFALLALLASPAVAQVDGLSYTLSPAGTYVRYDGNAALKDHFSYGGRLGFGFGRYVELDAEYLRGVQTETTFENFDASAGVGLLLDALPARDVAVQRVGGGLRVNVGRSRLLPFLRGGAGVVQIDPENVDATRSIYVTYGGGLTVSAAQRYTLTLEAARDVYRYSPLSTFALGGNALFTPENLPIRTVHNLSLAASLRLYLGGRASTGESAVDEALAGTLSGRGVRVFVEPAYGQIRFSEDLGAAFPERQPVAGVSAGVDLGPYVGLRASYLRATDEAEAFDDGVPSGFRDLALYGGELNFRFATRPGGVTPYLALGGGYLNAGDDYASEAGTLARPDDRPYASVGAGLDVPLTSALRLKAAARSLLMSDLDATQVASPSRVYGSTMFTGGLEFSLGGRARSVNAAVNAEVERRVAEERAQMEADLALRNAARDAQLRAELDSLRLAVVAAPNDSVRALRLADIAVREAVLADSAAAAPVAAATAPRTITIPVPERGEIYIRYGDPAPAETQVAAPIVIGADGTVGGMSSERVAALVRAELERQQGQQLTRADVDQIVRDATRNLQTANAALLLRLSTLEAQLAASRSGSTVVVDSAGETREVTASTSQSEGVLWGRELYATLPFVGARFGGDVQQAVVGLRGDFRLPSGTGMRFLPEFGIGVGDGVSVQAFANTAWGFPMVSVLEPYVGIGAGLKTDDGFDGAGIVVNLLGGAETVLGNGRGFLEYSTLDFFDVHRVLVGYRVNF